MPITMGLCWIPASSISSFHRIAGAYKPERETPILGLWHGVLTDRFIFRHILGHFLNAFEV